MSMDNGCDENPEMDSYWWSICAADEKETETDSPRDINSPDSSIRNVYRGIKSKDDKIGGVFSLQGTYITL